MTATASLSVGVDRETIAELFCTAVRGCEARVIMLTDCVVKLYTCPRLCMTAHEQQELAARHDLGPDVYGPWSAIEIDGKEYYYYVSERVRTLEFTVSKSMYVHVKDWNDARKIEKDIDKLAGELIRIGINRETVGDLIPMNVGWKDDKMVCIDFGRGY